MSEYETVIRNAKSELSNREEEINSLRTDNNKLIYELENIEKSYESELNQLKLEVKNKPFPFCFQYFEKHLFFS
jgi:hypothetical protein